MSAVMDRGARAPRMIVLHAIRGRCRMRVSGLGHDEWRAQLEQVLQTHTLVRSFRFNVDCDSLTIQHGGSLDAIVRILDSFWRRSSRQATAALAGSQRGKGRRSQEDKQEIGEPGSHAPFRWAASALLLAPLRQLALVAWIPLVVCSVPIWKRALLTLRNERRLNVDFLDGLALTIALLRGQVGTGALMAWMVHFGDVIRDHTALRSRRRIRELLDFESLTARLLETDGNVRVVRAEDLVAGQQALLLAGDVVPADGTVNDGIGAVDQRHITGESVPATRREGEQLYAGSSVVEGRITMRVTGAGQDTAAARIVQMLESAPAGETRMQNYAEKFADRLVAPLLGANTALLALTGNIDRFMSVAIVDYGTGIRVAAPTSILSSMTRAAHEGILIKSGVHVERLASLHSIAFDKTGTLTRGHLAILDVRSFMRQLSVRRVVQLAAAAETPLRHPVARALVRYATQTCRLTLPACDGVDFSIGLGVSARVGEHLVHVGSERYLRKENIATAVAGVWLEDMERHGQATLLVAVDGSLAGGIAYSDELRPEAADVVRTLRRRSVREIVMLTGDRDRVARSVAAQLGINRYFAEVLPQDKAQIIESLRNGNGNGNGHGGFIAMVGDGVNDSPALALADVGIALVDGADIARNAADVVLMEQGLFRIVDAIDISRAAMSLVHQNYTLLASCQTIALALALPSGWISPAATTLLSNGSAVAATLNAMRPLLMVRGSVTR